MTLGGITVILGFPASALKLGGRSRVQKNLETEQIKKMKYRLRLHYSQCTCTCLARAQMVLS